MHLPRRLKHALACSTTLYLLGSGAPAARAQTLADANFTVRDIKAEDLQRSLRNVGLATGKTFDRSVLEDVKQYLTDQYFSRGKYGVRVDTNVEDVSGNKVKIKIDI